ncbi:MAG: hypothetical protein KDK70_22995, partial [Myxococcales bacterium]|nr:hypothetical protein [Myxococcales bacterium]
MRASGERGRWWIPVAAWGLCALGLGLGASACRGDATTPALHTAAPAPGESGEPAADAQGSRSTTSARDLFFVEGPGRDAILARERRDHAAAREHLDALLAEGSLEPDQRGAAELLRGLEHLEQEQPVEAAERFAAARAAAGLAPVELRVRLWEAQARLDAGQPDRAQALLEEVDASRWAASAVGGDARMALADARRRTDDR